MTHYIYKHTNKINGKCYIGQTKNIKNRWRPEGYKYCRKFYRAILKYGWDNFTHEILRECTEDDVDFWEAYYIGEHDSIENGYNLEGGGHANKTLSDETRALISEAGKKRKGHKTGKPAWNKGLKTPDEVRHKLSEAHKGKKQPLSEETKKKIGEANRGRKASPETIEKLRQSHLGQQNRKGTKFTEEQKKRLSEAHKGQKPYSVMKRVRNIDTGMEFESATEAARYYKMSSSHISSVCKGTRKTAGGYRWEYINN